MIRKLALGISALALSAAVAFGSQFDAFGSPTVEPPQPIANFVALVHYGSITRQEARWIYTLKTRYWHDGSKISVYHLPYDNPTHQAFVREVLGMQPALYTKTIQANINSGVTNVVKEVKNQDEMIRIIETKHGAVGYLSKDYLMINGVGHVDVLKIID